MRSNERNKFETHLEKVEMSTTSRSAPCDCRNLVETDDGRGLNVTQQTFRSYPEASYEYLQTTNK